MYIGKLAQLVLRYHNFFEDATENSLTRFVEELHKMRMFVVLHME